MAVEAQFAARQSLARDDPENERECERGSVCAGSALLMRLVVEPFKSHCCHAAIRLAYIPTADQAADYLTKACPGALVRRFQSALDGSNRDNAGSVIASATTSPPGAVGSGLHGRSPFASPSAPTNQPIMTNRATHLHL